KRARERAGSEKAGPGGPPRRGRAGRSSLRALAGALLLPAPLACLAQRGDAPDARLLAAEEQRTLFHVPPGFEVQLVAAEPEIQKPMNLAFDSAGRVWVTG